MTRNLARTHQHSSLFNNWRGMSRQARRKAVEGYICNSPWLVGFVMFVAGPTLASLLLSLTHWDVGSAPRRVGMQNYVEIFTDDGDFIQSLKVTLTYAAVTLPLHLVLGLALSLLLNLRLRGMNFYRTLLYIPAVLPIVAVTMLWIWIFNPEFGIIKFMTFWDGRTSGRSTTIKMKTLSRPLPISRLMPRSSESTWPIALGA